MNQKFGTTLKVFSTDLNLQKIQVFSEATTPNVKIAEAVRASMSIPMFFRAWKFPDGNPNTHIYVDGGVMYNYPIDTFDSDDSPEATLGLFLTDLNPDDAKPNDLTFGITHLELYIKSVFESLMNSQNVMVNENKFEESRTVKIDDLGISATDFGITPAQAQQLYDSGLKNTQDFLNTVS